MLKKNGVAVLKAHIEDVWAKIKTVVEHVDEKLTELSDNAPEEVVVAGFAGYLNGFYNGVEKAFTLVAQYVDGFESTRADEHKELLQRMALDIAGVRPPVLSSELAIVLQDYLDLRQRIWHTSAHNLEWNELKPKAENLKPTFEKLEAAFQRFFAFLQAAGEQLD